MFLFNGVLLKLDPNTKVSRGVENHSSSPSFPPAGNDNHTETTFLPELQKPKKLFHPAIVTSGFFNSSTARPTTVRELMRPRAPEIVAPVRPPVRPFSDERRLRNEQRAKSRDARQRLLRTSRAGPHNTGAETPDWAKVEGRESLKRSDSAAAGLSGPVSVFIMEPSSRTPVREPLFEAEHSEDEAGAPDSSEEAENAEAGQAEGEAEFTVEFRAREAAMASATEGAKKTNRANSDESMPVSAHPAVTHYLSELLEDLHWLTETGVGVAGAIEWALRTFVREIEWLDRRVVSSARAVLTMPEFTWESMMKWLEGEEAVIRETQGFSVRDLMQIRKMFTKYQTNKEDGLKTNQLFDLFVHEFGWKPVSTDEQMAIIELVKDLDFNGNGLLDYDEFIHLLSVIVKSHEFEKHTREYDLVRSSEFSWRSVQEIRRLFWQLASPRSGLVSMLSLRKLVATLKNDRASALSNSSSQAALPAPQASTGAKSQQTADPVLEAVRAVLAGRKSEGLGLGEVFSVLQRLTAVDDALRARIFLGEQDAATRPYGLNLEPLRRWASVGAGSLADHVLNKLVV